MDNYKKHIDAVSAITPEQDGTGQPATRPESNSEGGDKPQPEAEGRSRQRVPGLDVFGRDKDMKRIKGNVVEILAPDTVIIEVAFVGKFNSLNTCITFQKLFIFHSFIFFPLI